MLGDLFGNTNETGNPKAQRSIKIFWLCGFQNISSEAVGNF